MSYNYWWMGFNQDRQLKCLQVGDSKEIEARGEQNLRANVKKIQIGDLVIAYKVILSKGLHQCWLSQNWQIWTMRIPYLV